MFLFFLQKGKTWRFSLYLFYVLVNPLYTLRRNPAESVTVDFFIADPSMVLLSFHASCSCMLPPYGLLIIMLPWFCYLHASIVLLPDASAAYMHLHRGIAPLIWCFIIAALTNISSRRATFCRSEKDGKTQCLSNFNPLTNVLYYTIHQQAK